MIVAITGGTGFIGKRLVLRHLARGDVVRVLSRRQPTGSGLPDEVIVYRGDLTNQNIDLLPFVNGVDILYHCAGEIIDQTRMSALHVAGTRRLIEAAAHRIGHWVQLSSVGAYGLQFNGVVTEDTPENPVGVYEITKTESDRFVKQSAEKGAFSYSILRPSNVYGPDMINRSLFQMIAMINKGFFFFIGKPGASANYIYVENVINGLLLCGSMPSAKGQVYNLSDQRTIEEFAAIIANALGKSVPKLRLPETPIRFGTRILGKIPGFPLTESRVDALVNRSVYSTMRIEKDLGYTHVVSMEDGLEHLVRVWKQEVLKN